MQSQFSMIKKARIEDSVPQKVSILPRENNNSRNESITKKFKSSAQGHNPVANRPSSSLPKEQPSVVECPVSRISSTDLMGKHTSGLYLIQFPTIADFTYHNIGIYHPFHLEKQCQVTVLVKSTCSQTLKGINDRECSLCVAHLSSTDPSKLIPDYAYLAIDAVKAKSLIPIYFLANQNFQTKEFYIICASTLPLNIPPQLVCKATQAIAQSHRKL